MKATGLQFMRQALPYSRLVECGGVDVDKAAEQRDSLGLLDRSHAPSLTQPSPRRLYNGNVTTPAASTPLREGGVRTIETLRGPAGRLEALLNPSRRAQPPAASVLLCHPHPLFGGTLHNKVVYHAMKTCAELGMSVLRFNFRGAGRSEGRHDYGAGEQEDVRAGLDWLDAEYGLPIVAVGFSFGAHMALRAGCPDRRVIALASLGTPVQAADRTYSYEFLADCTKPKLFLSGAVDPFGSIPAVEAALEAVPDPRQIVWIAGADHFFTGHLEPMQRALQTWLESSTPLLQRGDATSLPGRL